MKYPVLFLCLILAVCVFILPVIVTAAEDTSPRTTTTTPALSETRSRTTPVPVVTVPIRVQETGSGEVEFPVTRTETPTIPPTSIPPTVTIPVTTIPATQTVPVTQTVTVPVVTVTVLVYPSGNNYPPVYYYPGYPYAPNSYYNPYYQNGVLTVTSYPSNAVVILDGYNYGTTPYIFTGLTTGYHTIEIDYPGYEAYVTSVYIESGGNQQINADLTSLVSYGSLFIDSTPRGADVYVDGNYQGTSPVTVSGISAGSHQIELHLAGYEVLTSRQNVNGGQGTTVNLALTPYSASSADGSIDITSNQPGALVYLDGLYKGSTQSGNVFNIIAVSPGTHSLFLHLPGFADITRTVTVSAGRIANANAVFTSVTQQPGTTASAATGSIIVTSAPSGAQVSVDNQFRGVAPVTIYNVAPGTHIINLHLNGYSDYSTSVEVPANQVVQVPATLVSATGGATVPTRAGLSGAVSLVALVLGIVFLSARTRK